MTEFLVHIDESYRVQADSEEEAIELAEHMLRSEIPGEQVWREVFVEVEDS